MPQNKPMKIQWITVNGRQVPLVLPQTYSYADDDWKVTSDRDPLPIVEYGTTAGGIVVPKRVSDEGHELTQLTGSNVEEGIAVKDEIVKDLLEKIIERIGNNDYIFLKNVPLSAGADIRFQTKVSNSKFYLFGRFNVPAQVLIEQRADPARYGTIVNSFQKIYEGNAVTIAPTRFEADYPHIEVRVTNQSEQDIIIRNIVISDMTGGDQSAISDLENAITALGGSV